MLRPDLCDYNDAYIAVKEKIDVNPIQDWPFWDCSWMVGKKVPFPKSILIHNFSFFQPKGCFNKHGWNFDEIYFISK